MINSTEKKPERAKHLVYIAGYGRSGSTMLDISLARKYNGISLGEIRYSKSHIDQNTRLCSCSKTFDVCPFWSQMIDSGSISRHSTIEYFSILESLRLLWWGDLSNKINEFYGQLFEHSSHCSVIIDSSKTGPGAFIRPYILLRSLRDQYQVHLVGIYRHPSGVYQSLLKGSNEEMVSGKTLSVEGQKIRLNSVFLKVILSWSYANLAMLVNHLLFRFHGASTQIHSIEDLSEKEHEISLTGVSQFSGPDAGAEARVHMMGGNRLSGDRQNQSADLDPGKLTTRPTNWVDRVLVLLLSPLLGLLYLCKK